MSKKMFGTKQSPVRAKNASRLVVSGQEGDMQGKILQKRNVRFNALNCIWGDFKPQKWIPGKILILLDPHNLSIYGGLIYLPIAIFGKFKMG